MVFVKVLNSRAQFVNRRDQNGGLDTVKNIVSLPVLKLRWVSVVAILLSCSLAYSSVGTILANDTTPVWKHLLIVVRIGRISFRM